MSPSPQRGRPRKAATLKIGGQLAKFKPFERNEAFLNQTIEQTGTTRAELLRQLVDEAIQHRNTQRDVTRMITKPARSALRETLQQSFEDDVRPEFARLHEAITSLRESLPAPTDPNPALARLEQLAASQQTLLQQQQSALAQQHTLLQQQQATLAQQHTSLQEQHTLLQEQQTTLAQQHTLLQAQAPLLAHLARQQEQHGATLTACDLDGRTLTKVFISLVSLLYAHLWPVAGRPGNMPGTPAWQETRKVLEELWRREQAQLTPRPPQPPTPPAPGA